MKKIIIIGLLLLILVSTFYNSFAFELGEKDLKLLKTCEAYLKIFGKEKKVPFVVYQKDGKNNYQIRPYEFVDESLNKEKETTEKEKNVDLEV